MILTHLEPHPSAFDFATLARFLCSLPSSFLNSGENKRAVAEWMGKFAPLNHSHLEKVLHNLLKQDQANKQELSMFARVFTLRPDDSILKELVGALEGQMTASGKSNISVELLLLKVYF